MAWKVGGLEGPLQEAQARRQVVEGDLLVQIFQPALEDRTQRRPDVRGRPVEDLVARGGEQLGESPHEARLATAEGAVDDASSALSTHEIEAGLALLVGFGLKEGIVIDLGAER